MSLSQFGNVGARWRRIALALALAVAVLATAAGPPAADAAVSGQKGVWIPPLGSEAGEPGGEPGEEFHPLQLGVDPSDESVFIGSLSLDASKIVVQKLSASGEFEGRGSVPNPGSFEFGEAGSLLGIAVDPERERFYLLEAEQGLHEAAELAPVATKLHVFSTQPNPAGELVPGSTAELPLPAPNGQKTLLYPRELHVDPSNGDIVILARDVTGKVVLQRVDPTTGAEGARFVDTEEKIGSATLDPGFASETQAGFAVGENGDTYILTAGQVDPPTGWTLAAGFEPPALTALPGFAEAVTGEEWSFGAGGLGFQATAPLLDVVGFGPQVAVSTSADGDETLYFKHGKNSTGEVPGDIYVRGFSLDDRATSVAYGHGAGEGFCLVQTGEAAIAPIGNGDVIVLDQGVIPEEPGQPPRWGPTVLRFGPGGSGCPAPAASIALKVGGTEVSSVSPGTTVTLDGSGSELGEETLAQMTWTIEGGPGGTETEVVPGPGMTLDHEFTEEGEYTIRLNMKTSKFHVVGTNFAAQPKGLTVGAATEFPLNLSTSGTGSGGFECDTGSGPGPCAAEYPQGTVVTAIAAPDPGSEFVEWTGDCTGTGSCQVTLDAARNVGAVFEPEGAAQLPLNLSTSGTGSGGFECDTGSGPAPCAAEYPEGTVVTVIHKAAAGSEFVEWTGDCSGSGSCQVTLDAARNVGAVFEPEGAAQLPLNLSTSGSGSGSLQCDSGTGFGACADEYAEGTDLTIKAVPDPGSEFVEWSGDCDTTDGAECEVEIDAAKTIAAVFELEAVPLLVPLTVSKAGGGAGTVSSAPAGISCGATCEALFPHGTAVTLTATAAPGSSFGGWGGACSGPGPTCVVATNSATEVTAQFDLIPIVSPPQLPLAPVAPPPAKKTPLQLALEKCEKKNGKQRSQCVKRAKAKDKLQKAIKRCKKKAGKQRARCVKQAKALYRKTVQKRGRAASSQAFDLVDFSRRQF